jgi:dCMP deaminase
MIKSQLTYLFKKATCAGKRSIANYLIKYQGFSMLYIEPAQLLKNEAVSDAEGIMSPKQVDGGNAEERSFATAAALLDFVMKRWQRFWVTVDIRDDDVLEKFARRPWFILVAVDAPMFVRWERFKKRHVLLMI